MLTAGWLSARAQGHVREQRAAERGFFGVVLTYLVVELLGRALPRARPFLGSQETVVLVPHTQHRSFPSRHVASAFAMSIAVSGCWPRLARGFAAIGVLLGLARMAAGVHYPSDVLAGAVLGIGLGRLLKLDRDAGG